MIKRLKGNKATGYDGVQAENWKIFYTVMGGNKILNKTLIKLSMGRNFLWIGNFLSFTIFVKEKEIAKNQETIQEFHSYPF
jgi:hypothetical protein